MKITFTLDEIKALVSRTVMEIGGPGTTVIRCFRNLEEDTFGVEFTTRDGLLPERMVSAQAGSVVPQIWPEKALYDYTKKVIATIPSQRIQQIKEIRTVTSCGLKEATDYVVQVTAGASISSASSKIPTSIIEAAYNMGRIPSIYTGPTPF